MMQMGSIGLSVKFENPMHLGDGLRIFRRTVIARRDKFAPGTIEVAAPIRNNTVTAVRTIAAAAITDNGVIWNSRRDRNGVNPHYETIIRRHSIHAIRNTLQLQRGRVGGKRFAQGPADCEQLRWRSH